MKYAHLVLQWYMKTMGSRQSPMCLQEGVIEQTLAVTGGFAPVDARPARLPNRLRVSRDVAEIAARHLAPPARPDPDRRSRR